jgi:hypothetical protein
MGRTKGFPATSEAEAASCYSPDQAYDLCPGRYSFGNNQATDLIDLALRPVVTPRD